MNKSRGTTLIEMLLCISIISMLSIFTLRSFSNDTQTIDIVIFHIVEVIEDAKYLSTMNFEQTNISLNSQSISYDGSTFYEYTWSNDVEISQPLSFYYNSAGHVSKACSTQICQNGTCKSITIHLETGHVNVYES